MNSMSAEWSSNGNWSGGELKVGNITYRGEALIGERGPCRSNPNGYPSHDDDITLTCCFCRLRMGPLEAAGHFDDMLSRSLTGNRW
jgi:hypothetical protein